MPGGTSPISGTWKMGNIPPRWEKAYDLATPSSHVVDLNSTVDLEMIWVEPGYFYDGAKWSNKY